MNKFFEAEYFNSIYKSICTKLLTCPEYTTITKDGHMLSELVNPTFELKNIFNCFTTIRDLSFKYLQGELEFYYGGSPFLNDINKYSKFWNKISDDGRTVNSNYGKLVLHDRNLHNYTQFEYAKDMLIQNPESKKAVMLIYNKDHSYKSKDNPCTMFLQFMIRDRSLNLFVKMRSSDVWFGLPYDVPFFCTLQYKMYLELVNSEKFWKNGYLQLGDLKLGSYFHTSTSLHMYERNREKLEEYMKNEPINIDQKEIFLEMFYDYN